MDGLYLDYLALLENLRKSLEQLTGLARQKTNAVRGDDLAALDGILKQEQVISLSIRGYDQKRLQLLKQLELEAVALSALPQHYPEDLRRQAKDGVEALQREYRIYRSAAEVARNTLECNLHEVEKLLAKAGGETAVGPGYVHPEAEPPASMKTDFRA